MFPPDVDAAEAIESIEDEALEISRTSVSASFSIAGINVTLSVDIHGEERKFANILLENFFFDYNNSVKSVTEISVILGGLSVEDLLYDGEPGYRYLLKSSNSETIGKDRNIGVSSRLSRSCPESSSFFDCTTLSTSLPSVLHNSPKKLHASSPLRPMMHYDKKFPSQPHMAWNRDEGEDESGAETGDNEDKEESWVKIHVSSIDEEDNSTDFSEAFVSFYPNYHVFLSLANTCYGISTCPS